MKYLDFILRGLLRFCLTGPIFFIAFVILLFIFKPPEDEGFFDFFKPPMIWANLYIISGLGFFSVGIDYFNKFIPDRLYNKLSRYFGAFKNGNFSSYYIEKYLEREIKNVSVISLNSLDEFIHQLYQKSKGEIFLFNPSPALINKRNKKWDDIRKAIKKNEQNLDKIVIYCKNISKFPEKKITNATLGVTVIIKQIPKKFLTFADNIRFGLYYFTPATKKVSNIDYLIYRPINN